MFNRIKFSRFAVLAIGVVLSLTTAAQAAPLGGIYWAALDETNKETGHFYYAPLNSDGTKGTTYAIGTLSYTPSGDNETKQSQVTFMQVLAVGGVNYLYYTGYNDGDGGNMYRAELQGSIPGGDYLVNFSTKTPVIGFQNRAFAVDANTSGVPQVYSSNGDATLNRYNADAPLTTTPTAVDTRADQKYDAMHLYTDGGNTHLLVGMRDTKGIYDYTFTTGGVPALEPAAVETTVLSSTPSGGDLYDIAYNTSNGDLYYVDGYNQLYKNGAGSPFASGVGEIKQFALDRLSGTDGYLYYADEDTVGILKRVNLFDLSLDPIASGTAANELNYAMFIVEAQEQGGGGVPEPSTFVLAGIGLMGLGLVAWKRRKNVA